MIKKVRLPRFGRFPLSLTLKRRGMAANNKCSGLNVKRRGYKKQECVSCLRTSRRGEYLQRQPAKSELKSFNTLDRTSQAHFREAALRPIRAMLAISAE